MTKGYKLLVKSASEIVLITDKQAKFLTGPGMKSPSVIRAKDQKVDGLSLLVDLHGKIAAIGPDEQILKIIKMDPVETVIDAAGMCLLPGFVDAHTHPVWAGDRVHEFAMKLAGATYQDVHKAGGGIYFTVEHTRSASEESLYNSLRLRLMDMLANGTTLVEAKSGYGLDLENELKLLRVIQKAKLHLQIEISATYCGAHAVPKGKTAAEATQEIVQEHIPKIKEAMDRGEVSIENIDVFCEQDVFNAEQTKKILQAGIVSGLQANFHGDELSFTASGELAGEIGAAAVSHLEMVSSAGIATMAKSGSVAVLLPSTLQLLSLKAPPVRDMIVKNVIVALGSDFNPNAYCYSMPLIMFLACTNFKMSVEEAIVAATLNAAHSVGRGATHGALETGRVADIVVVEAPRWEHLVYQVGRQAKLIKHVIKNGRVVYTRSGELEQSF